MVFAANPFEYKFSQLRAWLTQTNQFVTMRASGSAVEVDVTLVPGLKPDEYKLGKTVMIRLQDGTKHELNIKKTKLDGAWLLEVPGTDQILSINEAVLVMNTKDEPSIKRGLHKTVDITLFEESVIRENFTNASWFYSTDGILFPVEAVGDPVPPSPQKNQKIWRGFRNNHGERFEIEIQWIIQVFFLR